MAALADPMFWEYAARSVGRVQEDGSLRFVVLDKSYRMRPLVRCSAITFTQFLQSDGAAKSCKVAVIAGDSRPQSFWFGQVAAPTGDAWSWTFRRSAGPVR